MSYVLEANGLGKCYGRSWALRGCTLAIPEGHVVGLVGPNGAGKTTFLELVVGLLRPSAGTVSVLELSPRKQRRQLLPEIAFVAQEHPLLATFSVEEVLEAGRRLNRDWDGDRAKERLAHFAIPLRQQVRRLSGGQQAQVALTLALAKRPRLLVLDEPVARLDPLARSQFLRELSQAVADRGLSVILSSHVLAELERTCDYLVILTRGRVRVAESVRQLLDTHRLVSSMEAVPTRAVVGRTLEGEIVVRAERDAARGSRASLEQIVLAYLAGDGWDS